MSDSEGLNSEGLNGADQHRRIRDQSLLCICSINRARHGNSHPRVTWDRVDQIFCMQNWVSRETECPNRMAGAGSDGCRGRMHRLA